MELSLTKPLNKARVKTNYLSVSTIGDIRLKFVTIKYEENTNHINTTYLL